jgi:hypothetical protein
MSTAKESAFDLDIANIALSIAGVPNISSLDDSTTEARTCKGRVASAREYILHSFKWTFLLKRAKLSPSGTVTPVWQYSYSFKLPQDFVTKAQVLDSNLDPITSHQIVGDYIESDEEEVYLLYYSRHYQSERIPGFVKEMIGAYLADQISHKLNPQERPRIQQHYARVERDARRAELRNQPPHFYNKPSSRYLNA